METKAHPIRVDDEVWKAMNALAGKTLNDKLRAHLVDGVVSEIATTVAVASADPRIDEILEHVRSIAAVMPDETIPDSDQMEMIVDVAVQRKIDERATNRSAGPTFNPASIPGVQTGVGNLRQPRESGVERAQREGRERQDRARAMDSTDDPSIDRSDEYVSV